MSLFRTLAKHLRAAVFKGTDAVARVFHLPSSVCLSKQEILDLIAVEKQQDKVWSLPVFGLSHYDVLCQFLEEMDVSLF